MDPSNFLALGDSYTIGEGVLPEQSFPFQLVQRFRKNDIQMDDPHIIAKTGWTTDELIAAIKDEALEKRFDLITLLIGVNNQYRGYSKENYRVEFVELLQTAIKYTAFDKKKVFVLSIPDWGITPFAKSAPRSLTSISTEVEEFNQINMEEALRAGVTYIDITPEFNEALNDPLLLADDGLHPSGKMYTSWVNKLFGAIKAS